MGICYEIIPGVPNILNIPDWAETSFKPDGQTIRDKIRELLTRQELIRPFNRFAAGRLAAGADPGAHHVHRRDLRAA